MYDSKIEKETFNTNEGLTLEEVTRVGYIFEGWFKEEELINKIETIEIGTKEDIIVYAKWTPKQVYLSYDGNGHTSGTMANQIMLVGETYSLIDNKYEREGYTFVGWTKEKTSNNIIENQSSYTMEPTTFEIVKLYAKWSKDIYTLEELNTINDNNACFYTLKNDIDLTNETVTTIQEFYGVFDGNGHKLKNSKRAIFVANYGYIKNLQIENSKYSERASSLYIGGFIAYNKGDIKNCSFAGDIITGEIGNGNICIGGFCGFNDGNIISTKSEVNIITDSGYVGGFIGGVTSGDILNCYAVGEIHIEGEWGYSYAR